MNAMALMIAVQTTSVLCLSLVALRILLRRHTNLAASIGGLGLAAASIIVLCTYLNIPRPFTIGLQTEPAHQNTVDSSASQNLTPAVQQPTIIRQSINAKLFTLNFGSRYSASVKAGGWLSTISHSLMSSSASWILIIIAVISSLSLIRLCLGVSAAIRLRRQAVVVPRYSWPAPVQSFYLKNKQYVPKVQIKVHAAIQSPCVHAFSPRVIFVPPGFFAWHRDEAVTAFAHEFAHLKRRDTLRRLVSEFCLSIVSFHPLSLLLRHQAILAQEMATDHLAAQLMGSTKQYKIGLSRLLLRLNQQPTNMRWRLDQSVFVSGVSSSLIRRIEMLRQGKVTPCQPIGKLAMSLFATVTGAILICGSWGVVADEPPRIAKLSKSADSKNKIEPQFFSRQPLPLDSVAQSGFVYFDAKAAKEHPAAEVAINFLQQCVDKGLMLTHDEQPTDSSRFGFSLNRLETVEAGIQAQLNLIGKADPIEGEDAPRFSLSFGSNAFRIKTSNVVDWPGFVNSMNPIPWGVTKEQINGVADILQSSDKIEIGFDGKVQESTEIPKKQTLAGVWNACTGGVLTTAVLLPEKSTLVEAISNGSNSKPLSDEQQQMVGLIEVIDAIGLGIDVGAGETAVHFKVVIAAKAGVEEDLFFQQIENLRTALLQDEELDPITKAFLKSDLQLQHDQDGQAYGVLQFSYDPMLALLLGN